MSRLSTPLNYMLNNGAILESFSNIEEWVGSGSGSIELDETENCLKVTAVAGGIMNADKTYEAHTVYDKEIMTLKFKVDNPANLLKIRIMFCANSNFTQYLSYDPIGNYAVTPKKYEWTILPFDMKTSFFYDMWNYQFRPQYYRIEVTAKAGTNVSVIVKELRKNVKSTPKVTLQFDDGLASVYTTAFPIMQSLGFVGVVWIIGSLVGTAGYMTWEQLDELKEAGWTIGNHTQNHELAGMLTYVQQINAIKACRDLITSRYGDEDGYHIAYPGGNYNSETLLAMSELGMKTGRVVPINYSHVENNETFELGGLGVDNGTNADFLLTHIRTYFRLGLSNHIYYHAISEGGTTYETSQAQFMDHMNLLKMLGIDVVNIVDWYHGLKDPRKKANRT